jgi:lambda repressor-like predicted transcriptional regulator
MVELAEAGRTPADLSKESGVSAQTMTNWCSAARLRAAHLG